MRRGEASGAGFRPRAREKSSHFDPHGKHWRESGQILGKIYADSGFAPAQLRELHFDLLIALTARSHGAWLITSERADFELISRYRKFLVEVW